MVLSVRALMGLSEAPVAPAVLVRALAVLVVRMLEQAVWAPDRSYKEPVAASKTATTTMVQVWG
jgi:hypothetical protein